MLRMSTGRARARRRWRRAGWPGGRRVSSPTVRAAQQLGVDTLRPGLTCAQSNAACLDVIRDAGLGAYLQHRQGHGIGVGVGIHRANLISCN